MIARLIATLAAVIAGVAILAHTQPGASWAAVGGWALILAAFVSVTTLRAGERP